MKKSELPIKTCAICGLPYAWRKKWARCWAEVRYCSERCRRHRRIENRVFMPDIRLNAARL
ncbi:DUF2256 domain-containing protein [Pseudomonas sp. GW101-3H06]|uniref:DUF2256 domain-containing protein n=1 Tax=Pseudomonas sp. GW101-3H06 TaxID=2751347 RepID=UPI001A91A19C|nr:DUF2256 domain-containing protein [Pseudomonas sp. GW101-3H06]